VSIASSRQRTPASRSGLEAVGGSVAVVVVLPATVVVVVTVVDVVAPGA
jgi:hypothetical protein